MVCPVTGKGAQTRTVYLPEGAWYDYWTGKKYSGKQYVHIVTPLDTMPVFAKAGAIIPMQPEMKFTDEKPINTITLDIFPGSVSALELYEDDGTSLDYRNKIFSTTSVSLQEAAGNLNLAVKKPSGNFPVPKRTYLAKIRLEKLPVQVLENGSALSSLPDIANPGNRPGWVYDAKNKILYIQTAGTSAADINLVVGF
jgi:alpha-glucosidase (family GH31 glycosyl hydrolase)